GGEVQKKRLEARMRKFEDRRQSRAGKIDRIGNPIIAAVTRQFGITIDEIKSKRRPHRLVIPRQVAWFLMQKSGLSLPETGEPFGVHHTSVLHGMEALKAKR